MHLAATGSFPTLFSLLLQFHSLIFRQKWLILVGKISGFAIRLVWDSLFGPNINYKANTDYSLTSIIILTWGNFRNVKEGLELLLFFELWQDVKNYDLEGDKVNFFRDWKRSDNLYIFTTESENAEAGFKK